MIVAISLEGGIVQGATVIEDGDYKVKSVVIIDYDVDGMDISDITDVPQAEEGDTSEAYVYERSIDRWYPTFLPLVEWLREKYAPQIRHYVGPKGDVMATGRRKE